MIQFDEHFFSSWVETAILLRHRLAQCRPCRWPDWLQLPAGDPVFWRKKPCNTKVWMLAFYVEHAKLIIFLQRNCDLFSLHGFFFLKNLSAVWRPFWLRSRMSQRVACASSRGSRAFLCQNARWPNGKRCRCLEGWLNVVILTDFTVYGPYGYIISEFFCIKEGRMNKICRHSFCSNPRKKTTRSQTFGKFSQTFPPPKKHHQQQHLALKPRSITAILGFLGMGYVGFKLFGPEGPTVRASGFLGKVFL